MQLQNDGGQTPLLPKVQLFMGYEKNSGVSIEIWGN